MSHWWVLAWFLIFLTSFFVNPDRHTFMVRYVIKFWHCILCFSSPSLLELVECGGSSSPLPSAALFDTWHSSSSIVLGGRVSNGSIPWVPEVFPRSQKSPQNIATDGRTGKNLCNQACYFTVLFDLPLTNQNVCNLVRKAKATPFNYCFFSNIL